MCQKAYKLKIPELRILCDFFGISRSEAKDKDGLVDALLDFLGEPCEKYLKGKRGTPSKKASRKLNKGKEDEEEEEDDDDENRDEDSDKEIEDSEEEVKKKKSIEKGSGTKKTTPAATSKGKMPSDSELREWVKAYVKCHHMGKSTIKQAIEIASEKFEIDITPAKRKIKDFLRDAL